jgi:hypothetical protein
MLENKPNISYIFISYRHDDQPIASTIEQELVRLAERGRGKEYVQCFLDIQSIPDGMQWEPIIRDNIEITDWVAAIFTGSQSTYVGYEIGRFSYLNKLPSINSTTEKRLLCLHDVEPSLLPALFAPYQNCHIPSVQPTGNDVTTFWFESQVGRFLSEFCEYRGLYTPNHRKNPAEFTVDIARAAEAIATAFSANHGEDVKEETVCQLGFQLRMAPTVGDLTRIPDDTVVLGNSLTFDILSVLVSYTAIRAPQLTWGELKSRLIPAGHSSIPWMDKIEADIIQASRGRTLASHDITFLGRNGRIYRPILARHRTYFNGGRKFYILFIETLDRRFVGRRQTSILLAALIMASRLRFTYFENWGDTTEKKFGKQISLAEFRDNSKKLVYNLEWMEHETIEFGLDDLSTVVEAFGEDKRDRIERFYSNWEQLKDKLAATVLSGSAIESEDERDQVREMLLACLLEIRERNGKFLKVCIDTYNREVLSEVHREKEDLT